MARLHRLSDQIDRHNNANAAKNGSKQRRVKYIVTEDYKFRRFPTCPCDRIITVIDIDQYGISQNALPCSPTRPMKIHKNVLQRKRSKKENDPRDKPQGRPEQRTRYALRGTATKHPDNHDDARDNGSDADEDAADGGRVAGDGSQMDRRRIRQSGGRGRSRGESNGESSAESSKLGFHVRTLSSLRHFPSSEPYLDRSRARSSPTLFVDVHPSKRDNAEDDTDTNENDNSKASYVRHFFVPYCRSSRWVARIIEFKDWKPQPGMLRRRTAPNPIPNNSHTTELDNKLFADASIAETKEVSDFGRAMSRHVRGSFCKGAA